MQRPSMLTRSSCVQCCAPKLREEAPLSLLKSPLVSLWLLCSQAKGPRLLGRLVLVVVVLPSPAGHICWVMICQNAGNGVSSLCSAPVHMFLPLLLLSVSSLQYEHGLYSSANCAKPLPGTNSVTG